MTVPNADRQRVIDRTEAIGHYLKDRLDTDPPTLSEIDAAFYWGVLRRNLVDLVFGIDESLYPGQHAIVKRLFAPPLTGSDYSQLMDSDEWRRVETAVYLQDTNYLDELELGDSVLADMVGRYRALLRVKTDPHLQAAWGEALSINPQFQGWLLRLRLPNMRGGWVDVMPGGRQRAKDPFGQFLPGDQLDDSNSQKLPATLTIFVSDGSWEGSDVEQLLADALADYNLEELQPNDMYIHGKAVVSDLERAHYVETHIRLDVRSRLLESAGDKSMASTPIPFFKDERGLRQYVEYAGPLVQVVLPYPPPPHGALASIYDFVIRKDRQWHLQIEQTEVRQGVEEAIRTWAVALFLHAGVEPQGTAIAEVVDRIRVPDVGATTFSDQRLLLRDRMSRGDVTAMLDIKEYKTKRRR